MKNIFFLAVLLVLTACSNGSDSVSKTESHEIILENGVILSSKSENVDITFKEGESPFFNMYMSTGAPSDKIVYFAFYKAEDVSLKGEVLRGARPCRLFQILIPSEEVIEDWSKSPLVTIREDGTKHEIKIRLINQPKI